MDARRRMISKNFHHVLRVAERQTLAGPPESMREHIVAASKAMKTGDWKACKNYIINEKMNTKVCVEVHHEKACLRGFGPGPIQTWLYSHRRWLEAENFRFRK